MKQLFEVGDRVKLVNAEYIPEFTFSTGTVTYVSSEPNDGGGYTVRFELDAESQLRLDKAPGYGVTAASQSLKYLKPQKEKNKAAKLDAKLTAKLDKLAEVMIPLATTELENKLTAALAVALSALAVIDNTDSDGYNPTLKEIKKAMLVELREAKTYL
jgi:hypothetical protein